MMSSLDVVILGRIGYDLYSEEPHVPLPAVRRFSRYLGGSSANMAVGLSRLGARVGMVSCLGDDALSRFLIDYLNTAGVETSHVMTAPGFLPSLAITEVSPPDKFPQVFYRRDPVDTMLDATGDGTPSVVDEWKARPYGPGSPLSIHLGRVTVKVKMTPSPLTSCQASWSERHSGQFERG